MLWYVLAFGVGTTLGWFGRGWWQATPSLPRRVESLDHDEYLRRLDRLDRAYTDSIKEYDRLVTWASGGALLISVTFLEKLAPRPRPDTASLLNGSWLLLAGALLLSLASQYASSRVHSWRMNELNHLQQPAEQRADDWRREADRLNRAASLWGRATKWSTFLSGIVLVIGLIVLSRFAFLNTSFTAP